jgi:glycosyltransferase involved in cell wall biosynthesis
LIGPQNPTALAEKVEVLLNNEQLREKMGLAGKARVKQIFSIESMMEKYLFQYGKLAGKPNN